MTATEVNARMEKMLRMMSPQLGRLQSDFLDPLIEITYSILARQKQIEPMPEVLGKNAELDIEYIGPMPRSQKAEVAMSIEAWMMSIAELSQLFPDMIDVIDTDDVVRQLQDLRGVPASCAKSQKDVDALREKRAEEQRQMQEAEKVRMGGEAAEAAGKGAKSMQEAGMNGEAGAMQ